MNSILPKIRGAINSSFTHWFPKLAVQFEVILRLSYNIPVSPNTMIRNVIPLSGVQRRFAYCIPYVTYAHFMTSQINSHSLDNHYWPESVKSVMIQSREISRIHRTRHTSVMSMLRGIPIFRGVHSSQLGPRGIWGLQGVSTSPPTATMRLHHLILPFNIEPPLSFPQHPSNQRDLRGDHLFELVVDYEGRGCCMLFSVMLLVQANLKKDLTTLV